MTDKEIAALHERFARADEIWPSVWRMLPIITGRECADILAAWSQWREIGRVLARGFTLQYAEERNAEVCALCDAELACDDFGFDSARDAPGWYEQHIVHTPECLVTQARALLNHPADS